MSDALPDWPRRYYEKPGGKPFLFYVVYGAFARLPELSRQRYRTAGVFPGLELFKYHRQEHPNVLAGFQQEYHWRKLEKDNPTLAGQIRESDECLLLKGELEDQDNLNYLRDSVGLLTFLLDNGGIVVFDAQIFTWWEPQAWKEAVFQPKILVPGRHVVIFTSADRGQSRLRKTTWFHTRGMRKFGRPDISVDKVPNRYQKAVIDLCERFIEFQALGGIIKASSEIRMKSLPGGMICHHAGDLEDPDFNNVHVEITPPRIQRKRRPPTSR